MSCEELFQAAHQQGFHVSDELLVHIFRGDILFYINIASSNLLSLLNIWSFSPSIFVQSLKWYVVAFKYANTIKKKIDAKITPVNNPFNWYISAAVWYPSVKSAHDKRFVNARGNQTEKKADVPPFREMWSTSNNERWYIRFYIVSEMSATSESVILLQEVLVD